jgi:hypothetical protein
MTNPDIVEESGDTPTCNGVPPISNGNIATAIGEQKVPACTNGVHVVNGDTTTTSNTMNGCTNKNDTVDTNEVIDDTVDDEEEDQRLEVVPDDEENLLMTLEEEDEKAQHETLVGMNQPKAVEAAPRLLQAALKEGQVKADESEEEEEENNEQKQEKGETSDPKVASPEVHVHKRVSHSKSYLVFFLLGAANSFINP